jgi:hypothetical protein
VLGDAPYRGANPALEGLALRFFMKRVPDEDRTRREGRPVEREAEWVVLHPIANKSTTIEREVSDRERATDAYRDWKAGRPHGTPLEAWDKVTPDMADDLRGQGIYCVEHVASLPDSARVMNKFALRREAQEWLVKRTADAARLAVDERDAKIAALEARLAQLEAR